MFNSKKSNPKLSTSVQKMISANGGQDMGDSAFSADGFHQGERNNSVTFFYRPNSPDMTIRSEDC